MLFLLFILSSVIAAGASAQQKYRIVGYYPMWLSSTLPPSAIKFRHVTDINHAFAWPDTNATIVSYATNLDTALINTTHRAGRKILLSFGGEGATQTKNFSIVAGDSSLRKKFVDNVVSHLKSYHYDGADLDWEGPSNPSDRANEVLLVKQLRDEFRVADTLWLITMAIGPSDWSGQWRDFTSLLPYVDWFNVMEYDFHGSWSSVAGHNAPLSLGTDPISDPEAYSIELSIQYLTVTRGIPPSKLVLGIPFYGKVFGTSTLYTSFSGEQDLAYRDILSTIQSGSWTYVWDSGSKAPYYVSISPPRLITFDDSVSIALKCQYARSQGLSGVMIWELTQDVVGQDQPLMDVVGSAMTTTAVNNGERQYQQASGLVLSNNYPNPFNPSTVISYQLPVVSHVTLKVYDVLGREVQTLVNERQNTGTHSVTFDAVNLASGVYFYRVETVTLSGARSTVKEVKKMLLLR